ncbi:tetratricopeptide repeat protein [Ruegeria aquimaris]|uniref:Tetratricopeptide repeat protein n=1 Tax=Ruegeria aquimaris TaxID=2984333 RepID=A0ABT3AHB0_9RHOB|nr:tetratricopeptide repeat protein [Ruegeria sp. XHP0148]MCV2888085.1 tetratricopeptide repeat protein [Ruegeria sp. XHP0148]
MAISLVRKTVLAALLSAVSLPAVADVAAGSYLAARQAAYANDFEAAAEHYVRALATDPKNPALLENVVLSQLALGRMGKAVTIAEQMEAMGLRSQVASIAVVANLLAEGQFQAVLDRDTESRAVGKLVDGLIAGWAHMGTGSVAKALAQFDMVADEAGLRGFAHYHKAMALASVGDFEGAEALFAADDGALTTISRRAALARAEILSQLDRNAQALDMLTDVFNGGFDPALADIADRLAAGETLPFSLVRSVEDGLAEVFFTIGAALNGEASDDYTLVYIRTAVFLRPDHIDALLMTAGLLEEMGQFDLAEATYKQIPSDSPDYHAAELGRAEALRRAAKPDAAIEVLEKLAKEYPNQPQAYISLGDLQRQQESYDKAAVAYDRALELTEGEAPNLWFLHYARGISHERLGNWDKAEADFRAALALNPDQPQVLNYLGYSLVEKEQKLDEALDLIQRAVAARPDSGYIVDSLGWVLFRLGRYDEAVGHMERAVELMPVDPVVNDHLGDVLWAVGRVREAEFQWRRALSFIDPEDTDGEADPDRIRRKLESGLDAVLAEEGSPPLKVANGD